MYESVAGRQEDGAIRGVPCIQGIYMWSALPIHHSNRVEVFVANPHKSEAVKRILTQNRERLLRFLPGFLADRTEDEQFTDEKSFLIRQIETLPPPA